MKLPGINYKTAVGPDVSSLPLQEARAWNNATDAWAQAIDGVAREFDAVKAQEAAIGAMGEMAEVEAMSKRGVWNVAEMGEPPADLKIQTRTNSGPQATYQMHEFADQYYDKRLKEVQEKYGKGLSSRAKRSFTKDLMGKAASQRAGIMERQYKQRIDINKATIRKVNDDLIAQATPSNAGATVQQIRSNIENGMKLGYFTPDEARRFENDRIADVEYTLYTNALRTDDLGELQKVQASVTTNPSRMSVQTRNQIWTQAERKIDRVSRKFEADRKEAREMASAQMLNVVLADIANNPRDTYDAMSVVGTDMLPADQKIAIGWMKQANNVGATEGDETLVNQARSMLLRMADPTIPDIGRQKANFRAFIIQNQEQLGKQSVALMKDMDDMEKLPYMSRDYRDTLDSIDETLVGMSRSNLNFGTANQQNVTNANDMRRELTAELQRNPSLNSRQWFDQNIEKYKLESLRKIESNLAKSRFGQHVKRNEDGKPDFGLSKISAQAKYKNGEITRPELEAIQEFLDQQFTPVERSQGSEKSGMIRR